MFVDTNEKKISSLTQFFQIFIEPVKFSKPQTMLFLPQNQTFTLDFQLAFGYGHPDQQKYTGSRFYNVVRDK